MKKIRIQLLYIMTAWWMTLSLYGEPAENVRELSWPDLTVKMEFEDPFKELSTENLMLLSIVARVESMLEHRPEKVSEGMSKEAAESRRALVEQGVDVEGLFAQRRKIQELRRKQATATNPELKDKKVSLPGYALPLEMTQGGVTEFLLVPWVGACIHTPPPPPNQMVHVTTSKPFEVQSRFVPVVIEGVLVSGEVSHNLFLVDGSSKIHMSYSMADAQVRNYKHKQDPKK